MFGETPLPLNAPVWVTYREAASYAEWKGMRLPSEPEFHRAAYATLDGEERPYPWGNEPPDASRGNFDFHHWDATDAESTPAGDSAFGVSQLVGNGWEWTSTQFGPFPGFEQFSFYPGYSQNFFDEEHYVMKGGSPRTAACMVRRSFRNWFRPNYPYVYAGFRVAEK
jgi:iron(II)-dependent oxidoreductase